MTLYCIPPQAKEESALFSVMGQDAHSKNLCGELFLEPGPVFHLPADAVLVSSQICGGSLRERLLDMKAASGKNLWLVIEPLCHLFSLPCPEAVGQIISEAESHVLRMKHQVYDSPEFVCQYCVIVHRAELRIHLFDTPQTVQKKIELACSLGVDNVIYIM